MKNVIYKISNTINDKIYVGSAKNFQYRKRSHLYELKNLRHGNSRIQNFVNKYGLESIYFEILEHVDQSENLISREQFYIDSLNPWFNICRIAGSRLGTRHSEETKAYMLKQRQIKSPYKKGYKRHPDIIKKIRDSRVYLPVSEETRKKISLAGKGKIMSSESRLKISIANKGKVTSVETKIKLSNQKLGSKNPMFGKEGPNKGKKTRQNPDLYKLVLDTETGVFYNGVKEACFAYNLNRQTLNGYLVGFRKNKTNLIYA